MQRVVIGSMRISNGVEIDESLIEERFVRASGPGGQNVNKVSTAVELRFNVGTCRQLSPAVKIRLNQSAGRKLTEDGVLVIRAERFRTQELNRADARKRLKALLAEALVAPKPRIKTKPSRAGVERRIKTKAARSSLKKLRRSKIESD